MLRSLPFIFLSLVMSSIYADDTTEFEKIREAYRENFRACAPFVVEWTETTRECEGNIINDHEDLRRLLERTQHWAKPWPLVLKHVQTQINELQHKLTPESIAWRMQEHTCKQFLATDLETLQYRRPSPSDACDVDLHADRLSLTADLLTKQLEDVAVFTFEPAERMPFKIWYPTAQSEDTRHVSVAKHTTDAMRQLPFPPLGEFILLWGTDYRHSPLDQWTTIKPADVVIRSAKTSDGQFQLHITAAFEGSPDNRCDRFDIWLRPDQGCIPSIIEHSYSMGPIQAERDTKFPRTLISRTVTDDIKNFGSGFYPSEVIMSEYLIDARWMTTRDPDAEIEGDIPTLEGRRRKQSITKFRAHVTAENLVDASQFSNLNVHNFDSAEFYDTLYSAAEFTLWCWAYKYGIAGAWPYEM